MTRSTRRPVVAHVLHAMGLGGVPEVAWQLISRLPPERATPCARAWSGMAYR
jgi:hypothetical protein